MSTHIKSKKLEETTKSRQYQIILLHDKRLNMFNNTNTTMYVFFGKLKMAMWKINLEKHKWRHEEMCFVMFTIYVATATFWARRFLENAYFEKSYLLDPMFDNKITQSSFIILKRQHLYQNTIYSNSPETPLTTSGTLWGFICSNP